MEIQNRKARFDYEIIDNYVAGLVLQGTETKQIRLGHCTLVDSWCGFIKNELWVYNMEVTTANTAFQHDPKRLKKLLLNKDELKKVFNEIY